MKRNTVLLSIMMMFLSIVTYSQESFKKSLETISTDLCSKMAEKGKKKVVVLFVTDINKAQTDIGKYMADVVSYYIVNNNSGFSVFDRENLYGIAEAKKLIAEGYIDVNNAKQLGKILSVETIVVGNYTVLSTSLSLTLKALDVNDGFVIAQSMKDLPIDKDAASLLGIAIPDKSVSSYNNKGFNNRPLNSNESYNNPETVNKECIKNNTGDYCFQNLTKFKATVILGFGKIKITVQPGETQCIYSVNASRPWTLNLILHLAKTTRAGTFDDKRSGQILIEKCKSKTYVIK